MTLGMAFTGQVLRFDQDAYWGLGIGASIVSRVPVIGPWLVNLLLGGPIIAGATLSRFFALHVFVIPGLLIAFVGLHVLLVLKLGVNEWPMPGRVVRRETYLRGVSRADAHETACRSCRTRCGRTFLLRLRPSFDRRLRRLFRSVRPERPAGPDDHPDRAAPRFLFPVALCRAVVAAAGSSKRRCC